MAFDRRGVSPLIGNILIVLIAIVLVSAIALALIPVIKKSLSGFGNCLDAQYSLELVQTKFSCYDDANNIGGITVKVNKDGLKKFRVAFFDSAGSSTVFDVADGSNPSGFGIYGFGAPQPAGTFQIQIPEPGQQLSYVASGADFVRAEIAPIARKDVCPIDDFIDINPCASNVNLAFFPPISVIINVCQPNDPNCL